ncbi:exo-alpha-sialidase [Arthrobacter sp. GMC3]|uniref:exo-alpha-sialidase n=1 Tax=Arthrobacter sp. GMC3 TaxID=2058894 RepID=UPI000CE41DC1|nr:exo-alpha-sialidase [Arthrobacter sp. GMC3]
MKSTDNVRRFKRGRVAVTAGALAAGLLTSMMGPAFAQEPAPAAAAASASEAPFFTDQPVAERGDNAISSTLAPTYRIPALVDLGGGVVLASYDGRPGGGDSPSPNSIVQRRSVDGGKTWGAPTFISRGQLEAPGRAKFGFSDPSYIYDAETDTVFNFHVYSKDQGFFGSILGTDDANRNVTSTEVSVSTDRGLTWSTDPQNRPTLPSFTDYPAGSKYTGFDGPLITDVAKPAGATINGVANVGGVVGMFASSGEGIQLKYGQHKGRLVQQYAGKVRDAGGNDVIQAYSVYSDDHGKTWTKGGNVGVGMDENKSVELSNGDLMLNSRDNNNGNGRKVTVSKDGGETWGPVRYDATLLDPTNNASIARMYPNASQGSAESKILLFSNANASSRSNGTIRYSCDDGTTWSAGKQFKDGYMAYSTVSALSDGTFGLLYEGDGDNIHFAKFNAAWLGVFCGASVTAEPLVGANGATVDAAISVTNTGDSALAGAVASFAAKPGWTFGSTAVPTIAPGETKTVSVPVTIPGFLRAGKVDLFATVSVNGTAAQAIVPTTITGGATENIVGLQISGSATDTKRDLATHPYTVGEAVPYQFRVDSLSNVTAAAVPATGNFKPFIPADGGGNCRYQALSVGGGYNCATPKHTVTTDELAQGFFVPLTTWIVSATGATTQNYTVTGKEVDLVARNASLVGTGTAAWNDVDGNGLANAGDIVTTTATLKNSGNVVLTDVTATGVGSPAATLTPGASVVFTSTRAVTADELAAGQVAASSIAASANNGAQTAAVELAVAALPLPVIASKPSGAPAVDRANLKGQPPVDLGLNAGKYSVGDTVTVHGAPANQWGYIYLNQHGQRFGWFLADAQGTMTFTVPKGTKNGKDTLVLLDAAGAQVSFGTFHVTP